MPTNNYLPFISDEDLQVTINNLLVAWREAYDNADAKLYSRVIDPFSALFKCLMQDADFGQWVEGEKARQVQKTFENYLGAFHQDVLASMPGWERADEIVDIKSGGKKVIAEVKNKYNTTKGNTKKNIYDDLKGLLDTAEYGGYIGYYVEVIPEKPAPYDKLFTPPDNETHTNRPGDERIRVIDGYSFYELASGYGGALRQLYEVIPVVVGNIFGRDDEKETGGEFIDLFNRAYGEEEQRLI